MPIDDHAERNKAVARRLYEEVITQGDLAALEEIVAPDIYDHSMVPQGHPPERATFVRHITGFRAAVPDIHVTADEVMAEGDRVVVIWSSTGTHGGTFSGIAPTGKTLKGTSVSILRLRAGQIAEYRVFRDRLDGLRQPGATITLPSPASRSRSKPARRASLPSAMSAPGR